MEKTKIFLALIPAFPLLGALLAFLVGRRAKQLAGWIATSATALSFIMTALLFNSLPSDGYFESNLFNWFSLETLTVDFLFRFDSLTAVMGLVVTGIGTLIHLYSTAYMEEDESVHRFFSYLNLFMFSMLLLVLGGNLLVLFVGWEGVGLCSYLLIGFWFKNIKYAGAGRKAFVVNRIGDAGFLIGVFLLIQQFGTLDFVRLGELIPASGAGTEFFTLVAFCLFVGATGKSAQLPLFVWLPDAMAGPTPVSALIHAATMVTAGVYMLARLNFLFVLAPFAMATIVFIAVATAFVAATIALTQNDIKKVLAYSTVSQLGFMFIAAGCGAFEVAIFHVVTHAFFKACLFLGSGSVIHACHHEQDMRHMGGLSKYMPITFVTYLVSTLAIAGIYPFSGYQSKHAILASLKHVENPFLHDYAGVLYNIVTFTAFLTAFYMTRSVALTFFGKYRGHAHPHESPLRMTIPLIVLGILATVGGLGLADALPRFLLKVIPSHPHEHETIVQSIIGSGVGIAGVALAFVLYLVIPQVPGKVYAAFGPLSKFLTAKYYIDELYGLLIIRPLEGISKLLWKVVDQGVIDGAVNGTAAVVDVTGEIVRGTQSGQIRHYAALMFVSATVVILFYLVL